MKIEQLSKILEEVDSDSAIPQWLFTGMKVLEKYADGKPIITAAENDIVFSLGSEELDGKITKEDAEVLAKTNWGWDDEFECLYHFV